MPMYSFLGCHGGRARRVLGRNEVALARNCWGNIYFYGRKRSFYGGNVRGNVFVLINLLFLQKTLLAKNCFLYHQVFWTKGTGKAGSETRSLRRILWEEAGGRSPSLDCLI